FIGADAFCPLVDALQLTPVLAVHLRQRNNHFERLILGLNETEHFSALDVQRGSSGEMNLEATLDTDDANVLAGGFRAVPRAAGYSHLHFGRRPRTPHELLDANA